MSRRTLILQGAQAASDARDQLGLDQTVPVDIYEVAEALAVRVRFLNVSMEGFYRKGKPPLIMLSALRPLARKAFTCAHELGHHWFGHGSTIDELQADDRHPSDIPEEILANAFAAFMLLPTIGVRRAFNSRGWKVPTATPMQILTIASEFGVGYDTLLAHLAITLNDMPRHLREELGKWGPQRIRKRLLGTDDTEGLVILDGAHRASSVDLDAGFALAVPHGATVSGNVLVQRPPIADFDVYDAVGRGRATVETETWKVEARVAPPKFIGPAGYRFLEDPDE